MLLQIGGGTIPTENVGRVAKDLIRVSDTQTMFFTRAPPPLNHDASEAMGLLRIFAMEGYPNAKKC